MHDLLRRDGRVAEGARLESVYTATYRGFESLSLRHSYKISTVKSTGCHLHILAGPPIGPQFFNALTLNLNIHNSFEVYRAGLYSIQKLYYESKLSSVNNLMTKLVVNLSVHNLGTVINRFDSGAGTHSSTPWKAS